MENNEKSNKGLVILIVIFSLMVLGLGGWMVYDKVFNKDEPKPVEGDNTKDNNDSGEKHEETDNDESEENDDNGNQETSNEQINNQGTDNANNIIVLEGYPLKSDVSSVGFVSDLLTENDFKKNFKNLKREKDGIKFVYNCTEFDKECTWIEVTINDVITIDSGYDEDYKMLEELYKINNFYIIVDYNYSESGGGAIYTIYDNNGKQVYNGYNHRGLDFEKLGIEIPEVMFNNNKMYIVETVCGLQDEEGNKRVCKHDIEFEYNIIDLSKDEISIQKVTEFYVDDPWGDNE